MVVKVSHARQKAAIFLPNRLLENGENSIARILVPGQSFLIFSLNINA